jgi:hypothetical protein
MDLIDLPASIVTVILRKEDGSKNEMIERDREEGVEEVPTSDTESCTSERDCAYNDRESCSFESESAKDEDVRRNSFNNHLRESQTPVTTSITYSCATAASTST